jgi:hypothetical protein
VRRWITRSAVAIVVLVAAALAGLWIRSYWRLDALWWVRSDGSTRAIISHHGAIHLIQSGTRGRERPMAWDSYRVPARATHASVHTLGNLEWSWLGFARVKSSLMPMIVVPIAPARPAPPAPPPPTTAKFSPNNRAQPLLPPPATAASGTAVVPLGSITPFGRTLERPLVPWLNAPPSDASIVPYWPLAALAGAYAAMLVRRRIVAVLRRRRRQCTACGYDLRGSPDGGRCPECGMDMPTVAAA